MNKIAFFALVAFMTLMSSCAGTTKNENEASDSAKTSSSSSSKIGEFEEFKVTKDWTLNPFDCFKGQGLLLAVGDEKSSNAMTIGWGALGNVWSDIGPATVTVYVAEGRYTYEFMEKYDHFTVMGFDKEQAIILGYMGTHSGRDGDKAAHLGLHTLYTENGTPYYAEAAWVLECKTIYKAPFEKEGMCPQVKAYYEKSTAGVHHMYIGNVVKALRRK